MQEHVPEQLDVVAVLGRLAVGVSGTQDESPGVQAAVALPSPVERRGERAVGQVFQYRMAAEDGADGVPGGGLAESPERGDLEQPVLIGTRLAVVAHVPDHVLRDSVGGPEHVTELELAQDRVLGPAAPAYPPHAVRTCAGARKRSTSTGRRSGPVARAAASSAGLLTVEHTRVVQTKPSGVTEQYASGDRSPRV